MAVIFAFSAQPSEVSNNLSTAVTEKISRYVPSDTKKIGADSFEQNQLAANTFIRKNAHFFLFFLLGTQTALCAHTFLKKKPILSAVLPLLFCLLYAALDEYHQTFVPGRGGNLRDVMIDFSGGALAVLLINAVFFLFFLFGRKKV